MCIPSKSGEEFHWEITRNMHGNCFLNLVSLMITLLQYNEVTGTGKTQLLMYRMVVIY